MNYDSSVTARQIMEVLTESFAPTSLQVEDQSHLHAGHRRPGSGGHFFVTIQSGRFNGLSPLARQRLVIAALESMMDREIHALSMRCQPTG